VTKRSPKYREIFFFTKTIFIDRDPVSSRIGISQIPHGPTENRVNRIRLIVRANLHFPMKLILASLVRWTEFAVITSPIFDVELPIAQVPVTFFQGLVDV
jgi:hypothetical protein